MHTQPIVIDSQRLAQAQAAIPASDFVDAQFDVNSGVRATDALIVLSTPRSGSTLLCELLRLNAVCLPHEYFQTAQYLPLLAARWQCLEGERLDEARYVWQLLRHRTFANGWIGINLHGSHLPLFARMAGHLSGVRVHYLHLARRDVIAQAVSYHIAAETSQWSSEFVAIRTADYDFAGISRRLQRIQGQNALIQAYLIAQGATALTIYYEDLVRDLVGTLRRIPGVPPEQTLSLTPTLRRQSGSRSTEWVRRFAGDYWNSFPSTSRRPRPSLLRRLLRSAGQSEDTTTAAGVE